MARDDDDLHDDGDFSAADAYDDAVDRGNPYIVRLAHNPATCKRCQEIVAAQRLASRQTVQASMPNIPAEISSATALMSAEDFALAMNRAKVATAIGTAATYRQEIETLQVPPSPKMPAAFLPKLDLANAVPMTPQPSLDNLAFRTNLRSIAVGCLLAGVVFWWTWAGLAMALAGLIILLVARTLRILEQQSLDDQFAKITDQLLSEANSASARLDQTGRPLRALYRKCHRERVALDHERTALLAEIDRLEATLRQLTTEVLGSRAAGAVQSTADAFKEILRRCYLADFRLAPVVQSRLVVVKIGTAADIEARDAASIQSAIGSDEWKYLVKSRNRAVALQLLGEEHRKSLESAGVRIDRYVQCLSHRASTWLDQVRKCAEQLPRLQHQVESLHSQQQTRHTAAYRAERIAEVFHSTRGEIVLDQDWSHWARVWQRRIRDLLASLRRDADRQR